MLQRPVAEAASRRPGRTGKTQLEVVQRCYGYHDPEDLSTPPLKGGCSGGCFLREPCITTSVPRRLWWISWFSTARSSLSDGAARRRPSPTRVRRCGVPFAPRFSTSRIVRALPRMWLFGGLEGCGGLDRDDERQPSGIFWSTWREMTEAVSRRYTVDTAQNPRAIATSMFGAIYMLAMDREGPSG